ncbi:acetyl-CoA hydrolase [Christensenellaceae bacterium]|nr:acetyl-CoA hydrolase [Christensenellaceae bacterium]BDF60770.1 acetyl-CoA hydrolase [Christensenellaceae bacterium]
MNERIKCEKYLSKVMSAEEAAKLIYPGATIGMSGFTPAGHAKAVPLAIAKRAEETGEKLNLTVMTGASVGDEIDGALVRAGAMKRRTPYQTNSTVRNAINAGEIDYFDVHLSQMAVWAKNGFFGDIDFAIVEIVGIDEEGHLIPSTSIGMANTYIDCAKHVILEINTSQPESLKGIHDVYTVERVPNSQPIPIVKADDRIGTYYYPCDFDRIAAIVFTDIPDHGRAVPPVDEISQKIADHIVEIIKNETQAGRLPVPLPPLQSGVGGVANAVLAGLKKSDFTDLKVYSEVLQDAVFDLIDAGKISFASGTSLTVSPDFEEQYHANFENYRGKIMLRPQEISNHPEVIRRLGIIAMNTAIEADIYGNTNSSHINGTRIMNGIGGSGDFAQNAGLSIFMTPSTAKNGTLSCIVPFVTHVDHTEHDIHFLVTEYGYADLRCLTPKQRAHAIIENCAHPDFRPMLREYLEHSCKECAAQQTPHILKDVFKDK